MLTLSLGRGTGKELMEKSLAVIKDKMNPQIITVDAQEQAIGFYQKLGFKVISDVFMEEGVPHAVMELKL